MQTDAGTHRSRNVGQIVVVSGPFVADLDTQRPIERNGGRAFGTAAGRIGTTARGLHARLDGGAKRQAAKRPDANSKARQEGNTEPRNIALCVDLRRPSDIA